jgi:hypothetical protein
MMKGKGFEPCPFGSSNDRGFSMEKFSKAFIGVKHV